MPAGFISPGPATGCAAPAGNKMPANAVYGCRRRGGRARAPRRHAPDFHTCEKESRWQQFVIAVNMMTINYIVAAATFVDMVTIRYRHDHADTECI